MISLVTGGAGFFGSHVARHCLALGHEVVVLDDLSGGFADQVPVGAYFVQGNITDHTLVQRLFKEFQFNTSTISLPTLPKGFRTSFVASITPTT